MSVIKSTERQFQVNNTESFQPLFDANNKTQSDQSEG